VDLQEEGGGGMTGLNWHRIETGGTCEYGNEPSGSIKCGKFLTSCKTGWIFKEDSAPWSK
jgi:hypothetical protein